MRALGPLAYRIEPPRHDGVILVGDAAGFLDPFTGEGIYAALRSAELAAEVAARALRAGDLSAPRPPARSPPAAAEFAAKKRVTPAPPATHRADAGWSTVARRLAARPALLAELMGVIGDFVPPRALLAPAFLAGLLPLPAPRSGASTGGSPRWAGVDPRSRLVALAETADARSLAEGALWIAAERTRTSTCPHWLRTAGRAGPTARPSGSRREMAADAAAAALGRLLFEHEGFRGNAEDYYDPRNSFLNDVLERRLGIPITLSVVYLDVAARPGSTAAGVGLPGHFVVRVERRARHRLLDPFHGGRCSTRTAATRWSRGCARRRAPSTPPGSAGDDGRDRGPHAHEPQGGVLGAGDWPRALAAPSASSSSARGAGRAARPGHGPRPARRAVGGVRDWEAYLTGAPEASDAAEVRGRLRALRQALASRN